MAPRRTARHRPHRDYPVAGPRHLPLLWVLVPLLLTAGGLVFLAYHDLLAGDVGTWLALAHVLAIGAACSGFYFRRAIHVVDRTLVIRSTMFTRRTAIGTMELERARVVDLAEHTDLKPAGKSFGYSLPGFQSGHFRTRGGGKAFCLITDASRVLAIPLRDRSWLLLSPRDPRGLLQDLQQLAAPVPTGRDRDDAIASAP